jgi:AhpD family alkylhydroperoxidase
LIRHVHDGVSQGGAEDVPLRCATGEKISHPHVTLRLSISSCRSKLTKMEMTVTPRLDPFAAAPQLMQSWLAFGQGVVANSGLEESLLELVKIRASQINACAFCLHMHTRDARKKGETEERIYLLDAWRESPLYSPRERAALAWTEALTLVAETQAPDDVYEEVKTHFTAAEQVALSLMIVAINGWNRVQVGFRGVHPVEKRKAA